MSKPYQPDAAPKPLAVRVPEACRMTGIGKTKLYALIAAGDLAKVKIGGVTLDPGGEPGGVADEACVGSRR
jgi:excisionase family DNA binding protein